MANQHHADVEITVVGVRRRRKRPKAEAHRIENTPTGTRIPRVSRLMALAIKFEDMIARGAVRDYADLAQLGYVTRARITQIMNLLHLAPDLQEALLSLRDECLSPIAERQLRTIVSEVDWENQRIRWHAMFHISAGKPAFGD